MRIDPRVAAWADRMTAWRRDLHAHPETAFEETRTAALVAETLNALGVDVEQGLAGTGVVGVLCGRGDDDRAIGLRADMDALDLEERTDLPHASTIKGKMHACGHDGHTAMLLGAAAALASDRDFNGKVVFIFQPAEETHGGGRRMVEEGLFDAHPVDAVYGMHNWPGLPVGEIGVCAGPVMATSDVFEIEIIGQGAHAAMPEQGVDPLIVASHVAAALPGAIARIAPATEPALATTTQIHGGDAWNVIPERAVMRGTARALSPDVRAALPGAIEKLAVGMAGAYGARAEFRYVHGYPPTINHVVQAAVAKAAAGVVCDSVREDMPPSMGAEDFAYMLDARPGCYVWLGAGPTDGRKTLHSPYYDFNDDILTLGASYWTALVEQELGRAA